MKRVEFWRQKSSTNKHTAAAASAGRPWDHGHPCASATAAATPLAIMPSKTLFTSKKIIIFFKFFITSNFAARA